MNTQQLKRDTSILVRTKLGNGKSEVGKVTRVHDDRRNNVVVIDYVNEEGKNRGHLVSRSPKFCKE